MDADGLGSSWIVRRLGLFQVHVTVLENGLLCGGFFEGGAFDEETASAETDIEDELFPGADRVVGDEVELLPE